MLKFFLILSSADPTRRTIRWIFSGYLTFGVVLASLAVLTGVTAAVLSVAIRSQRPHLGRRLIGGGLFTTAMLLLAVIIAHPEKEIVDRRAYAPGIAIVTDVSGSMTRPFSNDEHTPSENTSQETRAEIAAAIRDRIRSELKTVSPTPPIRMYTAADTLNNASDNANTTTLHVATPTALGEALAALADSPPSPASDAPPAAVIVISDGRNNSGRTIKDGARTLAATGTTVSTVCIGRAGTRGRPDIAVSEISVPWTARLNDTVGVTVILTTVVPENRPDLPESFSLEITSDHAGKPMIIPMAVSAGNRSESITVKLIPKTTGWWKIRASVYPAKDGFPDSMSWNNRREALIHVTADKPRITLVEGELRPAGAIWQTIMGGDDRELTVIDAWFKNSEPGVKPLDAYRRDLLDADAVCLVQLDVAATMSRTLQTELAKKIAAGAGLILVGERTLRSLTGTALEKLSPGRCRDAAGEIPPPYRLSPSAAGEPGWRLVLPALQADLDKAAGRPAISVTLELNDAIPSNALLTDADGRALIAFGNPGRGYAVAIASDQAQRWFRRRPGKTWFSSVLLKTCVMWAASRIDAFRKGVRLIPLKRSTLAGDELPIRVAVAPRAVTGFTGKKLSVNWEMIAGPGVPAHNAENPRGESSWYWTPHQATTAFHPPAPGEYRLTLTDPAQPNTILDDTIIIADGGSVELQNDSSNPSAMRAAAKTGDGAFINVKISGDIDRLTPLIDHLKTRVTPERYATIRRIKPVWLNFLWIPIGVLIFLTWKLETPGDRR